MERKGILNYCKKRGRDCLLFLREKVRIWFENGILMLGDF